MWQDLVSIDQELLIYLNNLGSKQWDFIWLTITNQLNWIPLFLLIFYLVIKAFGWKRGLFAILGMIILVAVSDQFTNQVKDYFMRLRPNNNPLIRDQIRTLISPQSNSFYSGHAATSSVFTVFSMCYLFRIPFFLLFKESRIIVYLYFFGCIICMGDSGSYHQDKIWRSASPCADFDNFCGFTSLHVTDIVGGESRFT